MSTLSPKSQAAPFYGIPLWLSLAALVAGLSAGVVFTTSSGVLGWAFLGVFLATVVLVSLLTEPRALFLMVASIPLLFSIAIVVCGWFLVEMGSGNHEGGLSATQKITTIYPLLQHFPVLAVGTLAAAVISGLRLALHKHNAKAAHERELQSRREASTRNEQTVEQATRARSRVRHAAADDAQSVTVEELLQRNRKGSRRSRKLQSSVSTPSPAAPTAAVSDSARPISQKPQAKQSTETPRVRQQAQRSPRPNTQQRQQSQQGQQPQRSPRPAAQQGQQAQRSQRPNAQQAQRRSATSAQPRTETFAARPQREGQPARPVRQPRSQSAATGSALPPKPVVKKRVPQQSAQPKPGVKKAVRKNPGTPAQGQVRAGQKPPVKRVVKKTTQAPKRRSRFDDDLYSD
ncbi:MAG: hypothetical protein Q4A31_05430 [Corynebacterium sp.]|uniref:DUF6542 domain-containing protein n=1 Tax=Corynebacterium sp. TaxID=1720 RepID=UPI0026DCF299|nr:DUF6542 domain-containing protein [Corynebacterium sp.]MDO4761339.1 hypothetical protein [Corynebacterium sp.]